MFASEGSERFKAATLSFKLNYTQETRVGWPHEYPAQPGRKPSPPNRCGPVSRPDCCPSRSRPITDGQGTTCERVIRARAESSRCRPVGTVSLGVSESAPGGCVMGRRVCPFEAALVPAAAQVAGSRVAYRGMMRPAARKTAIGRVDRGRCAAGRRGAPRALLTNGILHGQGLWVWVCWCKWVGGWVSGWGERPAGAAHRLFSVACFAILWSMV